MKWIKFIAISALLFFPIRIYACADSYSPAYCYMFSVYNHNRLSTDSLQNKHLAFWTKYTMGKVSHNNLLAALGYDNMGRNTKGMTLLGYLQMHKDADAIHYIMLLKKMLGNGTSADAWDYPTKKELAQRQQTWLYLLNDATKHIRTSKRLGSRYWLMAMRAAYYSNNRKKCEELWNQYQSQFANDYIKDIAQGYIASYWYKDGAREKAREFYAKVGDVQSLRWCFKNDIGIKGIEGLYAEAPNSVAFPYLIQDYVNSLDDDISNASAYWTEKHESDSLRQVITSEINSFRRFANRVISEGKVHDPALWQSAIAYLTYLEGDNKNALAELEKADKMQGTSRMKDNIRAIRFLIESDTSDYHQTSFDKYALKELKWLIEKAQSEPSFFDYSYSSNKRNHYSDVLLRIAYFHLTPNYMKAGRFATGAAITGMTQELEDVTFHGLKHTNNQMADPEHRDTYQNAPDFSSQLFCLLDTADVKDVIAYQNLLAAPEKGKELEQYATSFCYKNTDYYNDIIGTKYLRAEQFNEAREYFKKVSLRYLSSMNVAPYMHASNTFPLWFDWQAKKTLKRQRYVVSKFVANPKITFCDNMIALLQRLSHSTSNVEKSNICYDLANRYLQASHYGNCWAYTNYSWTTWMNWPDSLSHSLGLPWKEKYAAAAKSYLNKSMQFNASTDNKVRCLFALASMCYESTWRISDYDYNRQRSYYEYKPKSEQAQYFQQLYALRSTPSFTKYGLSRCDNLKSYIDWRRKN